MLVLRGVGEQGSGQQREFCLAGSHRQPDERSRTGRNSGICKLRVNLSRQTRKKAGTQSGARLDGRHQRSQLLCAASPSPRCLVLLSEEQQ